MTIAESPRFVRADGPDKVTGTGRYVADLSLAGMLHAKLKYAGVSHAHIVSIDTTAAEAMAGVMAVMTAKDVPAHRYSPGVADRTLFATDTVRFEADVVAAVAATTPEIAAAAVAAIEVIYEPLPVVADLEAAIKPDSQLVHQDWQSYNAGDAVQAHNVPSFSSLERGDAATAMATADIVVSSRYVADASHAAPIEPRGVVAQWEGNKVTIWSSTQVPFDARAGVCETLDLPSNRVRIIVPHLGGGFGGKCGFHFEAHVAALARATRRPVRLLFSREEEFRAPDRRREGMIVDLTTGLAADGTIVARTGGILIDCGAYIADGVFFPQLAAMHVAGPYKVPNLKIDSTLVYTNHQPSGSVRAPTAPQGCWALESHTDELAAAAGLDPVAFRKLNCVDTGDVGPVGQTYEEIGLQRCIDEATKLAGYGSDLPEDEAIGVAVGWWPSMAFPSGAYVKVDSDGKGQIITGAQECGTGAVMTLRQLAAEELGMEPEDFELVYQDTSVAPWDLGATGSQTLLNNGRAVIGASQQIADQLKALAAEELEASPADIVLANGVASVKGSPDVSVPIATLAGIAAGGELLLGHGSGTPPAAPNIVGATCVGDQGMAAWVAPQFSCHAAHIKLDRDTGVVRVLAVSAAHDSGTIINPVGATGQVQGGILMGIGQALTEITHYAEDGTQKNPGLLDYKLQTCADAPTIGIEFVQINTPNAGPHGAKGIAEAPNVATPGAVSNAIAKLLGAPVRQLPMSAERIWEAIDAEGGER